LWISRAYLRISDHCRVRVRIRIRVRVWVRVRVRVKVRGLGLGLQKFVLFTSLVNDDLYRDDKRCRGAYCVTSKYGRLAGTGATF